MLNTDFPEGTWQRQVFDATRSQIVATDPKLGAWVDLIAPTPEQVQYLSALASQDMTGAMFPIEQQQALREALDAVYRNTGGEALVREHHPELFVEPVKRGPGRPRLDGTPTGAPRAGDLPPKLTGEAREEDMLGGHDEVLATVIDRQHVADELWQDMRRFAEKLAETDHMLGSVQFGDTLVRTYSATELATLLGVTPPTLTKWRQQGYGPAAVRTGTRSDSFRYPVFRVVEWLIEGSAS